MKGIEGTHGHVAHAGLRKEGQKREKSSMGVNNTVEHFLMARPGFLAC